MAPDSSSESTSPFVLATPGYTLRAYREDGGTRSDLPSEGHGDPRLLERDLRSACEAGLPDPAIVGALPFTPGARGALTVESTVRTAPEPRSSLAPPLGSQLPLLRSRIEEPPGAEYARHVARAVRRLSRAQLSKVVLARTLRLEFEHALDPGMLFRRLAEADPGAYTFFVETGGTGETGEAGRTGEGREPASERFLVGASPELLVARSGRTVRSHPLAGSAPRSHDPDEDRERARALLSSDKDLHEHAFVVDAITAVLRGLCSELDVPSRPSVTGTGTMWHLGTPISGKLRDPLPSSLELALALHPTPAVCGTPASAAAAAIHELEPFDRGLYAGAVGWCGANGDGEWAVTLRCAEVFGTSTRLFAGAGIVADSVPDAELAETGAKFRTVLGALGLPGG